MTLYKFLEAPEYLKTIVKIYLYLSLGSEYLNLVPKIKLDMFHFSQ